ncbi:MAG: bifunctional phosphopantothenoylcysteine decarboxylase/phosphopantothenate--cysteine ligase CoaBC [Solirubrobacterales bacterium]|nr:bifunctional phosphopantothenoylcysteine decarboxylase/phosphopantothenate--cysteine ligase CoaBC [Solirubrobacterales bacterium]
MARLLLGVSGGVAAYKALETARLAVKRGHAVRVIQTLASTRFVGAASFQALTGAPVLGDEFERDPDRGRYPGEPPAERTPISHLALAERAEVYLIAPASANTIAKLAHGQADNLLTAAALAVTCPLIVAPAMNDRMYAHPATQANLELLRRRGTVVLPPGEGELASHGEHGPGRLPEPERLVASCEALLSRGAGWAGTRVLVTAGGTREPIDAVRYIGNRSSGRMGFALAAEAASRGADVTVVAAAVTVPAPPGVAVVEVQTAAELQRACDRIFEQSDVLLMAAAVADFRPAQPGLGKVKKGDPPLAPGPLELVLTEDVIAGLAARRRPGQVLVAFAAEHGGDAIAEGVCKLERKDVDAVVVNDVSRPEIGFDAADNEVVILSRDGAQRSVSLAGKERVARAVLDEVQRLRALERTDERQRGGERDGAGRERSRAGAGA